MTTSKRTPIPALAAPAARRLAAYYGAGQCSWDAIHAYNAVDARRKEVFLRESCAYLRSVGEHLRSLAGYTEQDVSSNRSGIAGSGAASADYYHPELARWLHASVETSSPDVRLSPREDCVHLLARWHQEPSRAGYGTVLGPNCWLNPNYDSRITAAGLLVVRNHEDGVLFHWDWRADGSLLTPDQRVSQESAQLAAVRQEEELRGAWEPIVRPTDDDRVAALRDDYTAPRWSSQLSGAVEAKTSAGARVVRIHPEAPFQGRQVEEVFLDRDLARDARAFLRALGPCLFQHGFTQMRVMEQEEGHYTWGEYLRPAGGNEGAQVRVKVGRVSNRDLVLRYDHVVVFSAQVPLGSTASSAVEEREQLYVPTGLQAQSLAARLAQELVGPTGEKGGAGAHDDARRAGRSSPKVSAPGRGQDQDASQPPLF